MAVHTCTSPATNSALISHKTGTGAAKFQSRKTARISGSSESCWLRLSHPPCPHLVPPAAALCNRATARGTTAAVTTCIAAESAGNGCAPADKLLRRRKTSSESSAYGKSPMAGTYCCHRGCRLTGSTGPSGRGLAAPPPPVGGDYPDLCAASDIIACVHAGQGGRGAAAARAARACMADFRIFHCMCRIVRGHGERSRSYFK